MIFDRHNCKSWRFSLEITTHYFYCNSEDLVIVLYFLIPYAFPTLIKAKFYAHLRLLILAWLFISFESPVFIVLRPRLKQLGFVNSRCCQSIWSAHIAAACKALKLWLMHLRVEIEHFSPDFPGHTLTYNVCQFRVTRRQGTADLMVIAVRVLLQCIIYNMLIYNDSLLILT